MKSVRRLIMAVTVVATTLAGGVGLSGTASADPPGHVVTLGDSAISGEAGRWAGNSNDAPWRVDTGADAYSDNAAGTAEQIPKCHRSKAAEAHIGTAPSLNLACSGARTYTQTGDTFKPGLDWYDGPEGRSQVVMLQEFAATNDVDVVTVLVGANNFGFADIVQTCVVNWLTSPNWWKNYCHDDRDIRNRFTSSAVNDRANEVAGAFDNVRQAMSNAGYADADYDVIVQTYWSPIPRGSGFRYRESGWDRQFVGGCGFWNRDADWANDTAMPLINQAVVEGAARSSLPSYEVLDMSQSLNGHRLCEQGVDVVENMGINSWTDPGAPDVSEWVAQIRTVTTVFGPYQIQESIHSNYWGQLAMRNCLRQAINAGGVQGGTCTNTTGVNQHGEPNMTLS